MAVSKDRYNIDVDLFRKKILKWYDKHRRSMPWRAEKGHKPDPYHVWLSEIMLQQTTVVTVAPYFHKFIEKWPTIHNLAEADKEEVMHEWAGLGYYARARNLHKCAQEVSRETLGKFPSKLEELKKLPGIGDYSSASIRAIAFDKPANVVDGNIERIMARLFNIHEPMPDSKKQLKELAGILANDRKDRPGDYAQALMDIGATICTPKSPKCLLCPVMEFCKARKNGCEEMLPRKKPKKAKPQKHGEVYWIANDNEEILFIRRGEKEMLGGMLGLPTSEWKEIKGTKSKNIKVKHSFTHFDLTLDVVKKHEKETILPENDPIWVPHSKIGELGLPTLFSKVVKLMK
jgi:A/G-specific adenine glycosylase